jgi:ubiquinone/menaquinone biosynthesis C-methylase UbiE
MKKTEELTASLYQEVHPYSDTSQITSNYIFSLRKGENFFKNKDVLDCGFGGTGWAIKLFCNQGAKSVTGVDLNLSWVQKIEKVIHHTTDWRKAISEMLRVCREKGNVFFMVYGRFGVLGNAVHRSVRLLGKIVPKKWAFFIVHKFHFFENHEFSILDAMYVPIELHFSEDELLSELSKYKIESI